MARTVSALRLAELLGDLSASSPAYRSIADSMRLMIDDGRVAAGTRLPSERSLAEALGCSRTTITRAYTELVDSGFAAARHGSGTVASLPQAALRDGRGALMPHDARDGDTIDLTCAVLPPPTELAGAYQRALTRWPNYLAGSGYYPLGVPVLREAVAERFTRRGLPTSADQVIITSGAIGAHAIASRALLRRGARVLVDSPTYPNGLASLRADGVRPVPMPLEGAGWDLAAWRSGIRSGAEAALLLPDHQNPTGLLMDDASRQSLARHLGRHGVTTLVDETLAESSISDLGEADPAAEPGPLPFAAHLPGAITIGGASKSHWSGFRVGWLRAPLDQVAALAAARTTLDLGSPVLEQLALVEMFEVDAQISRTRHRLAREGLDALGGALWESLPDWTFRRPDGGLSLWVRLPQPRSTALAVAAERQGVLIAPGPRFAARNGHEGHVRLPFTATAPVLREAVARLAVAWAELPGAAAPARAGERLSTPLIA